MSTTLSRFRFIALLEGISCIVLFFIAMPLKYYMSMPLAVKYVGWAHGLLFIAYMVTLVVVYMDLKWSLVRTFLAVIASIVPFGTFVFDALVLKKEEQSL